MIKSFKRIKKKKLISIICLLVGLSIVILTIGLAVGLTVNKSSTSTGSGGGPTLLVGTTRASVTLNNVGILINNQGRLTGGCPDLINVVGTSFENSVR